MANVRSPTCWLLTLKEKGEGNGALLGTLELLQREGAVQETGVPRYCSL